VGRQKAPWIVDQRKFELEDILYVHNNNIQNPVNACVLMRLVYLFIFVEINFFFHFRINLETLNRKSKKL
jgi:hypothetical protein